MRYLRTLVIYLPLLVSFTAAYGGGTAAVVCSSSGPGSGSVPVLQVAYTTGGDAGTPGLFWLGILSQDQTIGATLTPQGWQTYDGGLYPFQSRYDAGLPPTIVHSVPFPPGVQNTLQYVGYNVYSGHGVYSVDMRKKVADRRASLNVVKPEMVAKGRWRPEFDSDDHFIWTLIQKDMTDNRKFGPLLAIPFLECADGQGGGGS